MSFNAIVKSLVAAQYDPAVHHKNPNGQYPLCMPPLGHPVDPCCVRCSEPFVSGRTCPAVPRDQRWGPPRSGGSS